MDWALMGWADSVPPARGLVVDGTAEVIRDEQIPVFRVPSGGWKAVGELNGPGIQADDIFDVDPDLVAFTSGIVRSITFECTYINTDLLRQMFPEET